jgi:hypothetical protein
MYEILDPHGQIITTVPSLAAASRLLDYLCRVTRKLHHMRPVLEARDLSDAQQDAVEARRAFLRRRAELARIPDVDWTDDIPVRTEGAAR